MSKQIPWKTLVRMATISGLLAIPALIVIGPGLQVMGTASSSDVEDMLYARVEEYNRAVLELPDLADIVIATNLNSDVLTDAERQAYLAT